MLSIQSSIHINDKKTSAFFKQRHHFINVVLRHCILEMLIIVGRIRKINKPEIDRKQPYSTLETKDL